ncbi:hypothetical protein ACF08B_37245 [Streptomyces sp. NPDC015139]|uniref:hypothetical protein n=1 Tax=Streptomyces sp. NPDC015139 TaxID=3364942 RepID=UPI0036F623CF
MRSYRALWALVAVVSACAGCGRLAPPPVPDGEPTELPHRRMTTVWGDGKGGVLKLKPDGTFTAERVCGDYDIDAFGPKNEPRSGSGTWKADDWKGQTSITVFYDPGDVDSGYEALREGRTSKLWTYVGDPDDGHSLCVLTERHG